MIGGPSSRSAGNALILDGQRGTIAEQYDERPRDRPATSPTLVAAGWGVVVTHGNGPQVGLHPPPLRARPGDAPVPKLNLEMSVADSQGGIGHILGQALLNELAIRGLRDRVVCVLTHVVVDPTTPPSPTRRSRSARSTRRRRRTTGAARNGWTMVEDSGRGYRRVVASPRPDPDRRERPDRDARRRRLRGHRRRRRRDRGRRDRARASTGASRP